MVRLPDKGIQSAAPWAIGPDGEPSLDQERRRVGLLEPDVRKVKVAVGQPR